MTISRILTAVLGALAAALLLVGCGGGSAAHDAHATATDTDAPVISGEPANFNAADVSFATMMIPHHQQAVELAALVPGHTTNAELTALAQQISAAQEPEITTMKAFLVQWNGGESAHAGHDMSMMPGMVDAATMAKLPTLQGAEFDTLWIQSMIGHHRGAIDMAKTELADGTNADAKQLAQSIITAQQAEIDQMNKMLGTS